MSGCVFLLDGPKGPKPCGRPAELVERQCPAGRGTVSAAYCVEHGGTERASTETAREWAFAAPASVGGMEEVLEAGARQLGSSERVLVVRATPEGRWVIQLGVGGHLVSACPGSAVSREVALDAGLWLWRERVRATVESIRAARGGSLEWGIPIEPQAYPVVLELEPTANAWDALVEWQRAHPGCLWMDVWGLWHAGSIPEVRPIPAERPQMPTTQKDRQGARRARPGVLKVRISEDETARLAELAEAEGLTVSEYVRRKCLLPSDIKGGG